MDQLTTKQLQQVDEFVNGYVQYDDIRIEVVADLSHAIAKQLRQTPEVTFGKVLWELGHHKGKKLKALIDSKKKEMRKFWVKRLTIVTLKFFISIPMVVVMASFSSMLLLCHYLPPILVGLTLLGLVYVYGMLKTPIVKKNITEDEIYSFLATETYTSVVSWFMPVVLVFYFFMDFEASALHISLIGTAVLFFTLLSASFRKSLENYYEKFPLINEKRKAMCDD